MKSRSGLTLASLTSAEGKVTPLEFASYDPAASWCDRERTNVVTAITLAARSGRHGTCVQFAEVAWRSFMRSPWSGWIQVLEISLASALALGDGAAQAWLLTYIGMALAQFGRTFEAIDHFDRALPLCQAAGDRHCEAMATGNLGIVYRELKRFDDAIVALERSLLVHTATPRERGIVLMNLGHVYLEAGQPEQGAARMEDALVLIDAVGDPHGGSFGRSILADAYRQLERYADAVSSAERALEISQQVHDGYHEAAAWSMLGEVLAESGERDRARSCLNRAFELADRLGIPESKQIAASLAALDNPVQERTHPSF
jgi:tetratricopeptide (TPR) repeat protein